MSREEVNSGQLSSHDGVFVKEGAMLALNRIVRFTDLVFFDPFGIGSDIVKFQLVKDYKLRKKEACIRRNHWPRLHRHWYCQCKKDSVKRPLHT